jgi:hypothetical protein
VHAAAAGQRAHASAGAKAAQAQAAAVSPPAETQGLAADKHVQEMDAQQPRPFSRAKFKAALLEKIAATAPKTLGEAAKFKEEGKLSSAKAELHGTVDDSKKAAAGPVADTAAKAPDPSGIPAKPVTPLPGAEASPPPPDVGAGQAMPKPRPEAEVEGDGFKPSVPRNRERTSGAKSGFQEDNRRRSIRQAARVPPRATLTLQPTPGGRISFSPSTSER